MIKTNQNLGLLILRVGVAGLMLLHGIAKLKHGVSGIEGLLESKNLPSFFAYGVYVGEIIAPLLIIVGYRTRLAALVLLFNCFVAIFTAHSSEIFSLNSVGGWAVELLGLYSIGALVLFITGAGKYALSHKNKWD